MGVRLMHVKLGVLEIKRAQNNFGISFQMEVCGLISVNLGVLDTKKFGTTGLHYIGKLFMLNYLHAFYIAPLSKPIHTHIHTQIAAEAMQGPKQHIGSNSCPRTL